jgi:hypothetical protein
MGDVPMIRYLVLLIGLAGLMIAACGVETTAHGRMEYRPIYSLAAIRAGLARNAAAWLGRPILVRGVVTDCGPLSAVPIYCLAPDVAAVDPTRAVEPLPLVKAQPDRFWAFLRRLPLVGNLGSRPQAFRWDEAAIYRVALQVDIHTYCGDSVCYEAVLLDATAP